MHPLPVCFVVALAVLATSGLLAPPASASAVVEDSTGVEFPVARETEGSDGTLQLTGTGVRKKLWFKVYAFGLYADEEVLAEALASWRGQSVEALRDSHEFYEALIRAPGDKLAVMRFVRDVGADSMRDALDDALDLAVDEDDPVRGRFTGLFDETITDGEEVGLLIGEDGTVTVHRDGQEVGSVTSEAVGRALLLSWLGPETISEDIREGVVTRIPDLLERR
jgi:hypothetical protein